ncbi:MULTISPECIES: hypothetical protein [Streptomyces]|uniref:DUF2637 domain-containing protein n=1 Tax=Streptomyces canarius TaxID=285453 RepID=A0ABQ3CH25_9ACTN|nr:hypothetical protein [Streptomyces canarius]GHA08738.1 hypothetical protein GCM10010345_11360 [Streptomyces canarius]
MTDQTQPDQNESAVRATLRARGVRPAGHAAEEEPQPAPAVVIPPRPDYAPDVPAPAPRRGSGRLPDWWAKDKPQLGDEPAPPALAAEEPATDDQPDQEEPAEQPAPPPRPRPRPVEKQAAPDDEPGEEDKDEPSDYDEPVGERRRGKWIARVRRPDREPTRPPFATPVPLYHQREKKSLGELVREIKPHRKWLLFAGSGFVAGWYFGIPQFVEAATASVAHHPGRLQDNPDVYFWGVIAIVAVSLDRATRRSWFLIAWTTRALTVCLVVGAFLYGNPIEI